MTNKYRNAMDKITVTPQMAERILRNVSNNETAAKTARPPHLKWIKPVGAVAACFVIVLSVMLAFPSLLYGTGGKTAPSASGGGTQVVNPLVDTQGIEALKKAVPFELDVPGVLPAGYQIEKTLLISGKIAQIIYSSGTDTLTYREAKGAEDISGDYSAYDESHVVKVGDAEVTLKGSKSLVNLATWLKDGCSCALSFSTGTDKDTVLSIVGSLKKA